MLESLILAFALLSPEVWTLLRQEIALEAVRTVESGRIVESGRRGARLADQRLSEGSRWNGGPGWDDCPDGDDGLSIGPFQICRAYWEDAVAFDPSIGGGYEDCRRRDYAARVVRAYMSRYVPEAWARGDLEVMARTHNGGPRGAKSAKTLPFYGRVLEALGARS